MILIVIHNCIIFEGLQEIWLSSIIWGGVFYEVGVRTLESLRNISTYIRKYIIHKVQGGGKKDKQKVVHSAQVYINHPCSIILKMRQFHATMPWPYTCRKFSHAVHQQQVLHKQLPISTPAEMVSHNALFWTTMLHKPIVGMDMTYPKVSCWVSKHNRVLFKARIKCTWARTHRASVISVCDLRWSSRSSWLAVEACDVRGGWSRSR